MTRAARRYFISGRVQGVGYRAFAQRAARENSIDGYARNLEDGRVEVYAVGLPTQLDRFSGALRAGPRFSDVRGVDEQDAAPESVISFRIR
ncbi:MAG: acylphosphatase [Bryobacterales bacterium]|nr:acylphosphatase [Bryobacterales bacterium]